MANWVHWFHICGFTVQHPAWTAKPLCVLALTPPRSRTAYSPSQRRAVSGPSMALVPFWVRFPPDSFCVTVRSPGKSACEVPTTRPLTATFPRAASMAPEPGAWANIIAGITARNAHRPLRLLRHFLFGLMPYAPWYIGLAYHCDASRD